MKKDGRHTEYRNTESVCGLAANLQHAVFYNFFIKIE